MKKTLTWMVAAQLLAAVGTGWSLATHLVPEDSREPARVARVFPGDLEIVPHGIVGEDVALLGVDEVDQPEVRFAHTLPARFSWFVGDPATWRRDVPAYRQVEFREVYPGIHRVVTGLENGQVAVAWWVEPGADPSRIRFRVQASEVSWNPQEIRLGNRALTHLRAYQGTREVPVAFEPVGEGVFGFRLGAYDPTEPLVIDPDLTTLEAATYLGGSQSDEISDMVATTNGLYVVGSTSSNDFPTSSSAYDGSYNGGSFDVFVARLSFDLDSLYAATFLGGSGSDRGYGVDVNVAGQVVVVGQTFSSNFPLANPYDGNLTGSADAFVSLMSGDLDSLISSTYLGGSDVEWANDVAVGQGDTVFLCGTTYSNDFPTTSGVLDNSYNGGMEGFISAFTPNLNNLAASTYVSGDADEELYEIFAHPTKSLVLVVGYSSSTNIPMSSSGYDTDVFAQDAYVLRTNNALSAVVGATFFGEAGPSYQGYPTTGYTVTLLSGGDVVIGGSVDGQPSATPLSIVGGFDSDFGGYAEGFVARFDSLLQNLVASTYVGGNGEEAVKDVDWTQTTHNTVVITGYTSSTDMPYHSSLTPYDASYNGGTDAFVYTLAEDLSLTYGFTYYGGAQYDEGRALSVLPNALVIAGVTDSSVLPLAGTPYDDAPNGPKDGFLARFNNTGPPPVGVAETDRGAAGKPVRWLLPDRLEFNLPQAAYVGLEVYDPAGRLLERRTLGVLPAGRHELRLPGSGVALVRVRVGDRLWTLRVVRP